MADKTQILQEAQKFLARGQVDKAIIEYEKLLREGQDGNINNTIGDLYLKKGDKKAAVDAFHIAADYFRKEGFSLKALALYKKVLNINPADADSLYALGQLSEEKGLATEAIKYYLAVADSLSKEGKKDRLLEMYEKILSLSPSNIPLRNKVAEIFLKEGLRSDASKEYLKIAEVYEDKGDFPKAREYYKKILDLQPLNKEAVIKLGDCYEKAGELKNAIEHMKEACVLFHQDAEVHCRCAELLLLGGDNTAASEVLRKSLSLDSGNLKAKKLLGDVLLRSGRRQDAWMEYQYVIDDMILAEKFDDAIGHLKDFQEIDPVETGKRLVSLYRKIGERELLADELIRLGDHLFENGMKDDAVGLFKDVLDIRPHDEHASEMIQRIEKKPVAEPEAGGAEPEKEAGVIHIAADKTAEEIFIEADIFSRYGLQGEAIKILEGIKTREPHNLDVHNRLKSLYIDTGDKESAVTECLILSELYKRKSENDSADKMIKEALGIYPDDPRLEGREDALTAETPAAAPSYEEEPAAPAADISDYEEEIAEADFYIRQGLIQEAAKILERLHGMFPDNTEINERLAGLGQTQEMIETPETLEVQEPSGGFESQVPEGTIISETIQEVPPPEVPEKEEFEEFALTDKDLMEAQEMPEPELDNDVLEIFQEFKKGLERELGDEDSETHYNLGIAYKEMGLIDDAIKAFQMSRNDPKRVVQSSTMLSVCYMEKGLYSLAIDTLKKILGELKNTDESYWPLKYDLAEAFEKNNNLQEALDLYTEVYGWNASFRNISEKVSHVRALKIKSGDREKRKDRKDRVSYL